MEMPCTIVLVENACTIELTEACGRYQPMTEDFLSTILHFHARSHSLKCKVNLISWLLFLSLFLLVWFWGRVSLYDLGWCATYCVVQTGTKLGANLFIKGWDSMFQLPHSESDWLTLYKLLYLEWVRKTLTYHAHPGTSFWSQGRVSLNSYSTFSL